MLAPTVPPTKSPDAPPLRAGLWLRAWLIQTAIWSAIIFVSIGLPTVFDDAPLNWRVAAAVSVIFGGLIALAGLYRMARRR